MTGAAVEMPDEPRGGRQDLRRQAGERGSAVVWMMTATWLVVAAVVIVLMVAGGFGARQKARAAADMAALSAAADGPSQQSCAAAHRIARANGAVLVTCRHLGGGTFDVATEVAMPGWLSPLPPAQGQARAGY